MRKVLQCDWGDDIRWSSVDSVPGATTIQPGPYDVPELEAETYYAGVGPYGYGPKLIYRTSDDVFKEPTGIYPRRRLMRVVPVPDSHDFGPNVTWDAIRDQVCVLLLPKCFFVTLHS